MDFPRWIESRLHRVPSQGVLPFIRGNEHTIDYRELSMRHPDVRWFYYPAALSFSRLTWLGLKAARYEWVYLLNNDMVLDRQALREVVKWRGRGVFAVASQIFFKDSRRRREETGWTNCRMTDGIMEIFDVEPEDESVVRGGLYAGGGSSLFQKRVLRRVLDRADPYQPFYWEDAEWGVRAWKLGYEVLFSPMSKAWHEHRATISKYYSRPGGREDIQSQSPSISNAKCRGHRRAHVRPHW